MRIAITSAFPPSIGGIESVAELIAYEFVSAGHKVEVVASNVGPQPAHDALSFPVHYQPAAWKKAAIYARSDCILQFGFGLKALGPNLVALKPVVVSHQGIYNPGDSATRVVDRMKNSFAHFFTNVAASHAVARNLPPGTEVIPNCYDPGSFNLNVEPLPGDRRDIVCVARLVRDKGVDILLDALALLRAKGITATATVVGEGPERSRLSDQATRLGLKDWVIFAGAKKRDQVAAEYRRHRVAVIPSRYEEAFGIVALEAIASGCHVVASERGGLPEAVGPCGVLFDPSRPGNLAEILATVLRDESGIRCAAKAAIDHLARHSPAVAARHYLGILKAIL